MAKIALSENSINMERKEGERERSSGEGSDEIILKRAWWNNTEIILKTLNCSPNCPN